jgi:hypothetical protein
MIMGHMIVPNPVRKDRSSDLVSMHYIQLKATCVPGR